MLNDDTLPAKILGLVASRVLEADGRFGYCPRCGGPLAKMFGPDDGTRCCCSGKCIVTIVHPDGTITTEDDIPMATGNCQVCGDGEVNDPALDWCIACDRKMCEDCKAAGARNDEHGVLWCPECAERERDNADDLPET